MVGVNPGLDTEGGLYYLGLKGQMSYRLLKALQKTTCHVGLQHVGYGKPSVWIEVAQNQEYYRDDGYEQTDNP